MLTLLSRLFIRDRDNIASPRTRGAWGLLVSAYCIFLNLLLFAVKFGLGLLTGSLAVRGDAINNLSDAAAAGVALISFKISAKPADRDHPFGHARIEYIASLIVSFFILFIGVELTTASVQKLLHPTVPTFHMLTVILLSLAVLCKLYMAFFSYRVGKRLSADVIRANATDSLSDAAATLVVLLATLLAPVLPASIGAYLDPVMGLFVAVLVFVAGGRILLESYNAILGKVPTDDVLDAIEKTVAEYPEALGIHDVFLHNYGPGRTIASFHVEVDGKADIFASHDTIDLIERRLFEEHGILSTVHMDPIVTDDALTNKWREIAKNAAEAVDPRIHIHDFRIVPGLTHTNLIFDVAVPFELKISEQDLKSAIAATVREEDSTCFTVITVDRV